MTERHQQDSQQLELDVRIPGQRTGQRTDQHTDQAGPAPVDGPRPAGSTSSTAADGWQSLPWRTVARVSVSRSLLTWVVTMLVLAVMPLAVGWTPRVIMSGSMEPRVHTGDVVVTRPVDGSEIGPGTVITTLDPDKPGKTRTHRMVERDDDGMVVTKGDANPDRDSTPVADADVLGAGVLRVPFVGLPAYWLSVGDLVPLGLSLVVLTGAVLGSFRPRAPRSDGDPARGGGTAGPGGPHRPERRVRARGRRARRAGAAVTLTMAAALVVTGVPASYAAFASSTTSPASSFGAGQQFYPYRATVLADAPSFYWRLDETGGGSVADATGNGRGATADNVAFGRAGALPNETASTAGGFADTAVTSNGSSGLGGAYSIEAWVRTTSSGPLLAFTGILNTGIVDRALYVGRDGTVRFGNSLGSRVNGTKVNDGQWHHVVFTNASTGNNRGRLYVDGRLVGQGGAVGGASSGYWDAGRSFFLGLGWQSQPNDAFAGDLDELAVYPDVLTAAEVADHFAASGR